MQKVRCAKQGAIVGAPLSNFTKVRSKKRLVFGRRASEHLTRQSDRIGIELAAKPHE
jgi:hypothetical protein